MNKLELAPERFSATKLRDGGVQAAGPVRIGRRAWDVEAILAPEQVGNHDDCDPGFAPKKRLENLWIKIQQIIHRIVRHEASKLRDFRQVMPRLVRLLAVSAKCFLPNRAQGLVVVRGESRDRETLVGAAGNGTMV